MSEAAASRPAGSTVADYKRVLRQVLDNRPSGTRQRLAAALGTNRSFVSQMANPAYAMPIPAQHLEAIFEVCHFSPADRQTFTDAYIRAHPERREGSDPAHRMRTITLRIADLGDPRKNRALDELVQRFARECSRFAETLES